MPNDLAKTKEELIAELETAYRKIAELKDAEAECKLAGTPKRASPRKTWL